MSRTPSFGRTNTIFPPGGTVFGGSTRNPRPGDVDTGGPPFLKGGLYGGDPPRKNCVAPGSFGDRGETLGTSSPPWEENRVLPFRREAHDEGAP